MRVTIIRDDGFVRIDDKMILGVDVQAHTAIRALQWYEDFGIVEYDQPLSGPQIQNETVYSLDPFQPILDAALDVYAAQHEAPALPVTEL